MTEEGPKSMKNLKSPKVSKNKSDPLSSKRLDHWLVELGLAPSRTKAQELIAQEKVWMGGELLRSNSQKVPADKIPSLRLESSDLFKYVSRAGLKLEGALKASGLDPKNKVVLDLGISTGGFTDCLLQRGAKRIVGVDVGLSEGIDIDVDALKA